MKRKLFVYWPLLLMVALGGASALPSPGQETNAIAVSKPITLEEALRLARANHPGLRAFRGKVNAAEGRVAQAGLWSNPELELSTEDWPMTGGGFSDSKKMIGVSQTVPYPGKKPLERDISRLGRQTAEEDLRFQNIELAREVKTAFVQGLSAERLIRVADELVRVAESSAATARKRVEAGDAALQEQLRAEIQWEQAKAWQAGYEQDLASARLALASLIGRMDLKETALSGTLIESADATLLSMGWAEGVARHPSAVAARLNRERASLEERRAGLEPYPDVKFGLAGGHVGASDESLLEFRVSLPLPIIDRSKGKQREARANVDVADAEIGVIEQRLRRDWESACKRYRTAAERAANDRERILPKVSEALRLVQTGFDQGKFGFIDLLDTQRTAAEARLAYQLKLVELNLAQVEIETLRGAGSEGALRDKK